VYLAVRGVVCVLQAVPVRGAFAFAGLLARLAYRIDKRHRLVAAENLQHAFPERSGGEIDNLVRGCYEHYALMIIEMVLLPRKLRTANWRRYGSMVHGGTAMQAFLSDRPTLIVTAHLGNWELAGFAIGAFGFRSYAIARTLDNPHLETFFKKFRQATGQTIIAKKDDFDRLQSVLLGGQMVATLADQDAGPRGVFVDFFGRPASAHKAVALMALEYDAMMVVTGTVRVGGPLQYEIITADRIDPRDYAGRADAVHAITQRYHAALETIIRQYPEQYFWLHRRWKSRPQVRAIKRAA
jgi:Kdo2-lipid IVA lauroyltransferase/acyltransferase